jgi:hypothetical protein
MHSRALQTLLLCLPICALAQGTFVYDQQSSTDETPLPYGAGAVIQQFSSFGQSFTPTLNSIDFIRLKMTDNNEINNLGVTLYLNLRAESISGPILSTSPILALPNGFTGTVNFLLPASVSLTPGVPYFFEPIVQSGDLWTVSTGEFNYPGGSVFANGVSASGSDFWFREGIIVPEPSSLALAMSGLACFAVLIRRRRNC